MTARKIEIADELWGKVRVRAFETGTTAAALVTQALEALLAKPQSKSSDGAPRSARPPEAGIGGVIEKSHEEDGVRVIEEVRLMEVSVTSDTSDSEEMPWDKPKIIITTTEEAAQVAATLPAIRPVPKPSSKPRSRRSTGKSS